jgi:hypothetical protein
LALRNRYVPAGRFFGPCLHDNYNDRTLSNGSKCP